MSVTTHSCAVYAVEPYAIYHCDFSTHAAFSLHLIHACILAFPWSQLSHCLSNNTTAPALDMACYQLIPTCPSLCISITYTWTTCASWQLYLLPLRLLVHKLSASLSTLLVSSPLVDLWSP